MDGDPEGGGQQVMPGFMRTGKYAGLKSAVQVEGAFGLAAVHSAVDSVRGFAVGGEPSVLFLAEFERNRFSRTASLQQTPDHDEFSYKFSLPPFQSGDIPSRLLNNRVGERKIRYTTYRAEISSLLLIKIKVARLSILASGQQNEIRQPVDP